MISIRTLDYTTDESPEKIFSRLTWAVEKVDGLFRQLISNVTVETNRPWIGVYDHETMKFGLIEPRGFLSMRFFQIIVRGQVSREGNHTVVNIKIQTGMTHDPALLYVVFRDCYNDWCRNYQWRRNQRDGWSMLWILVFPVTGTVLLHRKLNRIEMQVEELFGFR